MVDAIDENTGTDLAIPLEEIIIIEGANDSNSSQNALDYDAFASIAENELNASDITEPNENARAQQDAMDVKPNLVPLYDLHTKNNSDIISLLEEPIEKPAQECVELGDDLVMTYDKGMKFKPLAATGDGLTKRENPDEISGMIPFNETVNKLF